MKELIQTKDYLLWVDTKAEIKDGDTILENISGIFSPYEIGDIVENPKKNRSILSSKFRS